MGASPWIRQWNQKSLDPLVSMNRKVTSGRSRISQGRQPREVGTQIIICPDCLENCIQMKKIGRGRSTRPKFVHVDPLLVTTVEEIDHCITWELLLPRTRGTDLVPPGSTVSPSQSKESTVTKRLKVTMEAVSWYARIIISNYRKTGVNGFVKL